MTEQGKDVSYTADDPRYVELRYQGRQVLVAAELFTEEQFALGRYICQKLGIEMPDKAG